MKKSLSRKNIWDKTPRCVKSTLGRVLGRTPVEWWLGRSYRRTYRYLRRAQWWTRESAEEYQLCRLREVLSLAYERSRFYRQAFNSVGVRPTDVRTLDDMVRLPTIDKQAVSENLVDMCVKSAEGGGIDSVSTGGTSGTPLHFYINAGRSSVEYAYLIASWERVGYRLGMPVAVLRGRMVRPDRNGLYHEYDPILRHHYYSNFHLTNDNMGRYLQHMQTIGSCMFHAYPSSAHALARFILAGGGKAPQHIKGVLLESETVYPDQLADIERAFRVRALSCYGHSEKLVLAAQCEHASDYHVWPTYGYFELLDAEGRPVNEPGQEGEIVGTGFINTVVPFIRYRTGDRATYVGERCDACGREHTVVKDIRGRWPQGGLISADGSVVSMTTLNVHDDTFRQVREYQFVQSVPGKATLAVIPMGSLTEDEQKRIVLNMNKRLQGQVVLDLKVCAELEKTARGKQPRVVQRCVTSNTVAKPRTSLS